jgi:hypothetical protein
VRPPYSFVIASGTLPSSMTLSSNGLLSGSAVEHRHVFFRRARHRQQRLHSAANLFAHDQPASSAVRDLPSGLVSWWRAEGNAQ